MSKVIVSQEGFEGGEISSRLDTRHDLDFYNKSCKKLENVIIKNNGAIIKRPGLKYIYSVGTAPPPGPAPIIDYGTCGEINEILDSYEFDNVSAYYKNIAHVRDNIYIIAYSAAGIGTPATFTVEDDGTIGTVIDRPSSNIPGTCFLQINQTPTQTIYAIFTSGGYYQLRVITFAVDEVGVISDPIDDITFDTPFVGALFGSYNACRAVGNYYVVANGNSILTVEIDSDGTVNIPITDYKIWYGPYSDLGGIKLCNMGNGIVLASYYVPYTVNTWYLKSYQISASGDITQVDSMTIDNTNDIDLMNGYTNAGFPGFLMAQGSTLGVNVTSYSMTGAYFGAPIDTHKYFTDVSTTAVEPMMSSMGGAGVIINAKTADIVGGYIRDSIATFTLESDGTLSNQIDARHVWYNNWSVLYQPRPVNVYGDIWLFGVTNITDQDGYIFTVDISTQACLPLGTCAKYN